MGEILVFIFVLIPWAIGYIKILFSLFELEFKIREYFSIRKQFMKQYLASKENNEDS